MMPQKIILHIFPSRNLKYTECKYNYHLNKLIQRKYKCIILMNYLIFFYLNSFLGSNTSISTNLLCFK